MTLVADNAHPLTPIPEILEALPGVERVIVEGDRVWLICWPDVDLPVALEAARKSLQNSGLDPVNVVLQAFVPAERRDRERVRFESLQRIEEPDVRVRVRVALEWRGQRVEGEATGEKGSHIELRTAALAALAALEKVADRPVDVRLAGVKSVRAFDAELMVVSLYKPGPDFQKYLGAVLAGPDPLRASALAVLHALNRILGNYLMTR
jgi:hypothetical protein